MRLLFLSHPEVVIDPGKPVGQWGLSELGRSRGQALAARLGPHLQGWRLIASPERKAQDMAGLLAPAMAAEPQIDPRLAEVDRSATGYVAKDRHDALARALFAHPEHSAEGWETAVAAQARVVQALQAAGPGDLVLVGHGATGAFLWCHLMGHPITPACDQPRQGCGWFALGLGRRPTSGWRTFEQLPLPPGADRLAAGRGGC